MESPGLEPLGARSAEVPIGYEELQLPTDHQL